jgi:HK97 family phage prohead protease
MADLSTADINDLPDSAFAYIEDGGTKDASGKTTPRDLRHFPVHDKAHADNAAARIAQGAEFGDKAIGKVKAAQKKFGEGGDGDSSRTAAAPRLELMRDFPLSVDDLHIVRSADGGDGRTMDAYAAVFNSETEIHDAYGDYIEVIDPAAFNKTIADLKRSRQGIGLVKVMFNHGRDLNGEPNSSFMMPVATPKMIEATSHGLLTRSRFNETPLGDQVLELVRSGSVTSMSFSGRIVRSDPSLRRHGRYRPDASGSLPVVRRQELGLREFGPVLFSAYEEAGINGIRMATPGNWEPDDDEEVSTSRDEEAAPATEPQEHSAGHSALATRMRALTVTHPGIEWRGAK